MSTMELNSNEVAALLGVGVLHVGKKSGGARRTSSNGIGNQKAPSEGAFLTQGDEGDY